MSRTISFYVVSNATTPAAVEDVEIRSYASDDITFEDALAVGTTGADGIAAAVLEPGDYTAVLHKYQWEFDRFDFTVEDISGQVYEVVGHEYAPPTPEEPTTCMVYGYLRGPSGDTMIEPTLRVSLWADRDTVYIGEGVIVADASVEVEVADDGSWAVPLVPNVLLKPLGSRYMFEFTWRQDEVLGADNPRIYEWKPKVTIPEAATAEFGRLIDE